MKNIIKINSLFVLFLLFLFPTCRDSIKKTTKNFTNKSVIEIEMDTTNLNVNYKIVIIDKKCKKKYRLISIPIDEAKYHLMEIYNENNQCIFFYEYTSVRPVYNTTMYINNNTLNIDSIVKGSFNFEKVDYDLESIYINENICNYNFNDIFKK